MMSDQVLRGAPAWFAVHCTPFKEWLAATALGDQLGLNVYLPQIKQRVRGRTRYLPLFPRYLFVQSDIDCLAVNRINAIAGIVRLVSFDGAPQSIPHGVIEHIRRQINLINAEGGMPQHNFRPGSVVRLKSGPLQGLDAIFIGPMSPSERVRILIEFLGSQREAEVDVDLLEAVAAEPVGVEQAVRRPRRTRGHGRFIHSQRLREEH
jgi:transcription antitermination factor NusG